MKELNQFAYLVMRSLIHFMPLQSSGTYYAAARLAGATPPPAHVLSRSIGLQVCLDLVQLYHLMIELSKVVLRC